MNPGQRINLLRKLAKTMATYSPSDGDLFLRQFGFANRYWDSDLYSYYINMLEEGTDDKLLALHEYVFPGDALPSTTAPADSANWDNEEPLRLFISHSSSQKLLVKQIKQELLEYGIQSFVAHEDIEPTTNWLNEIKKALNTCHAFTALICDEFPKSKFCDQEVGFALQRGVLVIPISLSCDPHGFMALLQAVNAREKSPTDIAASIFELIEKNPTTSKMAERAKLFKQNQLVEAFLNSSNFSTSTNLLKKIESYGVIPNDLLQKISDRWEKNDQVSKCAGIPRRITRLFEKHQFIPF